MNSDFKDLLRIFAEEQVEYLIVGAYAVMHYTQPRYTKDINIWLKPTQIDFLTSLPGIPNFEKAWQGRSTQTTGGITIQFLGKTDLITAKKLAGRPQDISDLDEIKRADS